MAKAIEYVLGQPWAMLPEMVETLISIADRTNGDPEAVAARLGRPLENSQKVTLRDSVAILPIRGPISRYASIFGEISGATSVDILARDLTASLDNPDVRGIVLEIDSPGGQAAGIGELAGMIRNGTRKKPIYAYVSNMGASAALWAASAASKVILAPSATMGSMGVVWAMPLPRDDPKGPRQIEFVSSQSPNKRPNLETESGRAEIQKIVDRMAQVFVESVASYRGLKPDEAIERFGRGGLAVGQDAVEAGMADSLGSLESVIEELNSPKDTGMKIHFPTVLTAWMKKGSPEVMEIAPQDAATAADDTENPETDDVASANLGEFTAELKVDTGAYDAAIEKIKADMEAAHKVEMRKSRTELFTLHANTYFDLHSGKYLPAERENLVKGYVGAAMLDAESPAEGFSYLDSFKASVETRKPHGLDSDAIVGDADEVAEKLSAKGLKVLPNAAATEAETKAAREREARLHEMYMATEEGRAYLAAKAAQGK